MVEIVTAPPKSKQVADWLRELIQAQGLAAGDCLLTVRALAAKIGVSTQVVTSAFDILDQEGVIERHVGRGTFVAQPTRTVAAGTAVLVFECPLDTHSREHILLPSGLQKIGILSYVLDVRRTGAGHCVEELKRLLATRPRVLVVDMSSRFHPEVLDWCHPDTQLIVVKRLELALSADRPHSSVLLDYEEAGRQACRHLLGRGKRRIGMLSFERRPGWTSDLVTCGCEEVLAAEGLALNNYLLETDGPAAITDKMQAGGIPDGLVMTSDHLYPLALRAFRLLGMSAGRDCECIGYGRTPWAEAYGIPSIDPSTEELTRRVLDAVETRRNIQCTIAPKLWLPDDQGSQPVANREGGIAQMI